MICTHPDERYVYVREDGKKIHRCHACQRIYSRRNYLRRIAPPPPTHGVPVYRDLAVRAWR